MKTAHNVLWKCSLSNGENVYEGKGKWKDIPGELSPWQRLLKYVLGNKLDITSLGLYTTNGRTWQLPSAGENPKFSMFVDTEKPIMYVMYRAMKGSLEVSGNSGTRQELYTVISACYKDDLVLQIWVSEDNPDHSWSMVVR